MHKGKHDGMEFQPVIPVQSFSHTFLDFSECFPLFHSHSFRILRCSFQGSAIPEPWMNLCWHTRTRKFGKLKGLNPCQLAPLLRYLTAAPDFCWCLHQISISSTHLDTICEFRMLKSKSNQGLKLHFVHSVHFLNLHLFCELFFKFALRVSKVC